LIAKPLYRLLKKNAIFVSEEEERIAFETLKRKLVVASTLAINPKAAIELHCDVTKLHVLLKNYFNKLVYASLIGA